MRHICFILILICWFTGYLARAQSLVPDVSSGSQGDRFYQAQQFSKALLWYSAAVEQDTADWYHTFRLAQTLRHLFRYQEALPYYCRVYLNALRRFPEAEFYYALMLKQQQRCAEALPLFDHFINTYQEPDALSRQAHIEKQGCYEAAFGIYDTSTIALVHLPSPVNTQAQDYAAVPYSHDSCLVLTSGRLRAAERKIDYRFGQNYTNQVLLERKGGQWKVRNKTVARWNTPWHDGPGCFNAGQTAFYFTRCQQDYCRIYVSDYKKGKWRKPTPLNVAVNAPKSNSKHPALSARGDTLFFVSDRPNGYGGTDLWMSVKDSSEAWSTARNLGETINTPFDEIAPFYYRLEDVFFFASRGHGGWGGMDLYGIPGFAHRQLTPVPKPLPYPFNSTQDDAFLAMGKRQGFLSTNRGGNFDVYQFMPDTTLTLTRQLFGDTFAPMVMNKKPFADRSGRVLTYDVPLQAETNDITVVYTVPEERLSNGSSRFVLNSNVNDIALRQLREQRSSQPSTEVNNSLLHEPMTFSYNSDSASLSSIATDFIPANLKGEVMGSLYSETDEQWIPIARTEVHLLNSAGEILKITTTNEIGNFHFVNLDPNARYTLALGQRTSPSDTVFRIQDLVVREYGKEMTTVPYETLYFDFNQSALRPEAKQALKDLAHYFRQNPQTAIEINAFTDSLGNDAYNMLLSQQRGESVFSFLLDQGVDRSALVINAQGVSSALSSTNSFVSQQLNRRVEIQLIGENITYYPWAETRILRPNVEINQLYQLEGVLPEELILLNGWKVEKAIPLKPLRVPVLESPALDQFFFDVNYQD